MKLGIGTYTFTWAVGVPGSVPPQPMTPVGLLREAARLGVKVVQFCDNLPLTKLSPGDLGGFEAELTKLGLSLELGTRGLDPANLYAHLELARRFRCSFLRLVIDSPGQEPSPGESVTRLRPIVEEFRAAGVRIAIENHDRFASAALAWMIGELGSEHAGICLDTVNSFGALESPKTVVETLGRFTLCLHVKDFTIRRVEHQMGFVVEGCPAGQGRLDVPWLLAQLQDCPNPFNAILENWVAPGHSLVETLARERSWADAGVRYLRGWIAG